jgi:phosphomannomutase
MIYNNTMEINQGIFKSYDVRGIYPAELNEASAFEVGRAFVRQSGATKIVLGQDARSSGPALFKALAAGILAEGGNVADIGQVPTECLYFALGNYDFDAGIMITASHNPKEYNGFKMMKKNGSDIEMIRGKDLLAGVEKGELPEKTDYKIETEKKDFWKDFLTYIFSFADLSEINPLKIVVDASNGVAGIVISKIQDKLPIEIIPLNFEPDGNFPNHSPNPLEEGSVNKISETIKKENADFGVIFDGDADRIFLVDETGNFVRADATLLLLAKYFLEKNPGMAIAYNAICSKAVPEFINKWGGKPVRTQVGFVNVREGLLKNNGIMGGELSGHYCYKDNYYMDSGMISFLTLLQIFSKDSRKVSEISKELSPYPKSPELNFKVKNKEEVLQKIKEKYIDPSTPLGAGGKADFLDGITVTYKDWWFNVRPSNTEPVLRLTIEAETQEVLDAKIKELTAVVAK